MHERLTIEFIKQNIEVEGYKLISNKYFNSSSKLEVVCPEEHIWGMSWDCWREGKRCFVCKGSIKHNISFVRESFEKEGYTLLSKEYTNANTKLDYICPKGHTHNIKWSSWQSGNRCPYCANNGRPILSYINSELNKENYILLSNKYINARTKLSYRCAKGHEHSMIWSSWRLGHRCPTCKGINMSINRSGPGNPGWLGGISFEPYCEIWKDKEYKQDIRERDDNRCLNPSCSSIKPNDLTIHHIDYNKKNCHPNNLITICRSCNIKANTDRDWHKSWYRAILFKRYGFV